MSKLRIIGGRYRGKRLVSPPDRSVRPTSERAREALFNILDHGGFVLDRRFLDLFSGTGAVGLEAFSRGASEVWLIDQDISLTSANVKAFGVPENLEARRLDAARLGRLAKGAPASGFDTVFLDPPYRSGLAEPALAALSEGWLAERAVIVVELAAREPLDPPPEFEVWQDRRYGAASFRFLRWSSVSRSAA